MGIGDDFSMLAVMMRSSCNSGYTVGLSQEAMKRPEYRRRQVVQGSMSVAPGGFV